MNKIAEASPEWYEDVRRRLGEEVASELAGVEARIHEEVEREYELRLGGVAWWRKVLLRREMRRTTKQRLREVFEAALAQRGAPRASAESLW